MALTDQQKYDAIFYLGYASKVLDPGSTHYEKILADRLEGLHAVAESRVISLLAEISAARTKFTASSGRMLVKRVGDIELNTDEHLYINKEYRRLLDELSSLLDIPRRGGGGRMIPVCL